MHADKTADPNWSSMVSVMQVSLECEPIRADNPLSWWSTSVNRHDHDARTTKCPARCPAPIYHRWSVCLTSCPKSTLSHGRACRRDPRTNADTANSRARFCSASFPCRRARPDPSFRSAPNWPMCVGFGCGISRRRNGWVRGFAEGFRRWQGERHGVWVANWFCAETMPNPLKCHSLMKPSCLCLCVCVWFLYLLLLVLLFD